MAIKGPASRSRKTPPPRSVYVDACVWIALLANEPSSPMLQNWLGEETGQILTARWSLVEVASGLAMKCRRKELDSTQMGELLAHFEKLLHDEVTLMAIAGSDFDLAAAYCQNFESGLRAGDALHLAVAKRFGATHLLTLDKVLAAVAEKMGFKLVNISGRFA